MAKGGTEPKGKQTDAKGKRSDAKGKRETTKLDTDLTQLRTKGSGGAREPAADKDLTRRIAEIRAFALDIARRGAEPGMMIVCNKISEPTPLPTKELLYDRCRWCDADIYYDRLMPSPADVTRVCIPCALQLMEAEKKGAN